MAFGQSAGPPASGRQVKDLLELLENAGHADFRDARGPMGFNQRQAGGKFTADEAAEYIDQLQTAEYEAAQNAAPAPQEPAKKPAGKKTAANKTAANKTAADMTAPASAGEGPKDGAAEPMSEMERAVRTASTKSLVLEVRRRGWIVTKPK